MLSTALGLCSIRETKNLFFRKRLRLSPYPVLFTFFWHVPVVARETDSVCVEQVPVVDVDVRGSVPLERFS